MTIDRWHFLSKISLVRAFWVFWDHFFLQKQGVAQNRFYCTCVPHKILVDHDGSRLVPDEKEEEANNYFISSSCPRERRPKLTKVRHRGIGLKHHFEPAGSRDLQWTAGMEGHSKLKQQHFFFTQSVHLSVPLLVCQSVPCGRIYLTEKAVSPFCACNHSCLLQH